MDKIFKEAIKRHGIFVKIEKLREEALELALAIERYRSVRPGSEENLFEEIADILNVIRQIQLASPKIDQKIKAMQHRKALKLKKLLDAPQ